MSGELKQIYTQTDPDSNESVDNRVTVLLRPTGGGQQTRVRQWYDIEVYKSNGYSDVYMSETGLLSGVSFSLCALNSPGACRSLVCAASSSPS